MKYLPHHWPLTKECEHTYQYSCLNKKNKQTKDPRLEAVENFKYLGYIISNSGSKVEIIFRSAQTTLALCSHREGQEHLNYI